MKHTAFLVCWLAAGLVLASDSGAIFHSGWTDLNKDGQKNRYEDAALPVEKRVNDLLQRMTLDEKIGQLWQVDWPHSLDPVVVARLRHGEVGSFLGSDATIETPLVRNQLQHLAVEASRLGIPALFGHDVIHGFRTAFPIPLGQACAWDPDLFERTTAIAAREAAAAGIDWAFAPMVDLARDPRWGRIAESFGEDPWLGARYAAACVRGLQGTNAAAPGRVVACLKHYVGYGAAEGGRDYNTTEISEFTLRNFYLPPFQAGVDAGAWTVMSAFNLLSGIPASGNRHTLTDILRGEWHFRGLVVSDYESVAELQDHGVAANAAEAARIALTAGVDIEMISHTYPDTLKSQIQGGTVPMKVLNEAVRRVLRVKFAKGLFDRPFTDETLYPQAYLNPDALALSREAAAKSCVLLKNDRHVLPLAPDAGSIALIGPLAGNAQELVGPWHSRAHTNELVSLAAALRAQVGPKTEVRVARGCAVCEPDVNKTPREITNFQPLEGGPTPPGEIADAVALAKQADVVVLALGEPLDWSGEDGSRSSLGLPGRQQELFDAVADTGKPVVVVLFSGRPLAITQLERRATAILEAWFPGTAGAQGVVDVLFGAGGPVGRLTTTFPRNVGQVPFYYNHYNTGRPGFGEYKGNYVDVETTPLYPFGFGLAYTTFEYGPVQCAKTVSRTGTLQMRATVKNTGARAGTTVAELYLRALASAAGPRPVRELKGFQKVSLSPGETREVSFELPISDLGYYDAQGHWRVEPGQYRVWISQDSAAGDPAALEMR